MSRFGKTDLIVSLGSSRKGLSMISRRLNPNPFNAGDHVGYSKAFLAYAGMKDGWAMSARGRVDRIDGMNCHIKWSDGSMSCVGSGSLELLDSNRR